MKTLVNFSSKWFLFEIRRVSALCEKVVVDTNSYSAENKSKSYQENNR